jgi:hypothetical protein
MVREYLWDHYRIAEGVLLVESGPSSDLSYITYRTEYKANEREKPIYRGLEDFKISRKNRDFCFGLEDIEES